MQPGHRAGEFDPNRRLHAGYLLQLSKRPFNYEQMVRMTFGKCCLDPAQLGWPQSIVTASLGFAEDYLVFAPSEDIETASVFSG